MRVLPGCFYDEALIDKHEIDIALRRGEGVFKAVKEYLLPIITEERYYFKTLRDIVLTIRISERNPKELEMAVELFDAISSLPNLRSLKFRMELVEGGWDRQSIFEVGPPPDDDGDEKMEEKKKEKALFSVFSKFKKKKQKRPFPVLEYLEMSAGDFYEHPANLDFLRIGPSFYELFLDRTPSLRSLEMKGI